MELKQCVNDMDKQQRAVCLSATARGPSMSVSDFAEACKSQIKDATTIHHVRGAQLALIKHKSPTNRAHLCILLRLLN